MKKYKIILKGGKEEIYWIKNDEDSIAKFLKRWNAVEGAKIIEEKDTYKILEEIDDEPIDRIGSKGVHNEDYLNYIEKELGIDPFSEEGIKFRSDPDNYTEFSKPRNDYSVVKNNKKLNELELAINRENDLITKLNTDQSSPNYKENSIIKNLDLEFNKNVSDNILNLLPNKKTYNRDSPEYKEWLKKYDESNLKIREKYFGRTLFNPPKNKNRSKELQDLELKSKQPIDESQKSTIDQYKYMKFMENLIIDPNRKLEFNKDNEFDILKGLDDISNAIDTNIDTGIKLPQDITGANRRAIITQNIRKEWEKEYNKIYKESRFYTPIDYKGTKTAWDTYSDRAEEVYQNYKNTITSAPTMDTSKEAYDLISNFIKEFVDPELKFGEVKTINGIKYFPSEAAAVEYMKVFFEKQTITKTKKLTQYFTTKEIEYDETVHTWHMNTPWGKLDKAGTTGEKTYHQAMYNMFQWYTKNFTMADAIVHNSYATRKDLTAENIKDGSNQFTMPTHPLDIIEWNKKYVLDVESKKEQIKKGGGFIEKDKNVIKNEFLEDVDPEAKIDKAQNAFGTKSDIYYYVWAQQYHSNWADDLDWQYDPVYFDFGSADDVIKKHGKYLIEAKEAYDYESSIDTDELGTKLVNAISSQIPWKKGKPPSWMRKYFSQVEALPQTISEVTDGFFTDDYIQARDVIPYKYSLTWEEQFRELQFMRGNSYFDEEKGIEVFQANMPVIDSFKVPNAEDWEDIYLEMELQHTQSMIEYKKSREGLRPLLPFNFTNELSLFENELQEESLNEMLDRFEPAFEEIASRQQQEIEQFIKSGYNPDTFNLPMQYKNIQEAIDDGHIVPVQKRIDDAMEKDGLYSYFVNKRQKLEYDFIASTKPQLLEFYFGIVGYQEINKDDSIIKLGTQIYSGEDVENIEPIYDENKGAFNTWKKKRREELQKDLDDKVITVDEANEIYEEEAEAYFKHLEEKYSEDIDKAYKTHFEELEEEYSKSYMTYLSQLPEYKEIEEKYLKKSKEFLEKEYSGWWESWGGKFDLWPEGVLEKMGLAMDTGGFNQLNTNGKRQYLKIQLDHLLAKKYTQQGKNAFVNEAQKDKFIRQYYYYFFHQHGGLQTNKDLRDGKLEETQFYVKTIAKTVEDNLGLEGAVVTGYTTMTPPMVIKWNPALLELKEELKNENPNWSESRLEREVAKKWVYDIAPTKKLLKKWCEDIRTNPEFLADIKGNAIWEGFIDGRIEEYMPIIGTLVDLQDTHLINLTSKISPNLRTQDQKNLLAIYAKHQWSQDKLRGLSSNYNIGVSLREMPAYVVELGITSPVMFATKGLIKKGLKKMLLKNLGPKARFAKDGTLLFTQKGVKKSIAPHLIEGVSLLGGLNAQSLAMPWETANNFAEFMTPEIMMTMSLDENFMRQLDAYSGGTARGRELGLKDREYGYLEAGFRSHSKVLVEVGTERLGFYLPKFTKKLWRGASKVESKLKLRQLLLKTPGMKTLYNADLWKRLYLAQYSRIFKIKTPKELAKRFSKFGGYDGVTGEFFEELAAIPLGNWADGRAPVWDGFFLKNEFGEYTWNLDKESLYEIGGATLIMSGAFTITGGAIGAIRGGDSFYYEIGGYRFNDIDKATKYLNSLSKELRLNENLHIKTNSFVAYGKWSKILEEKGLNKNQIKLPDPKKKFDEETAVEAEILAHEDLTVDEKERLLEIKQEFEALKNKFKWWKSENKEGLKEAHDKMVELEGEKMTLIDRVQQKIVKKRQTKRYRETVDQVVKMVKDDPKLMQDLDIIDAKNNKDVEKRILELYGLKRKRNGDIVGNGKGEFKNNEIVNDIDGVNLQSILDQLTGKHGAHILSKFLPKGSKDIIIFNEKESVGKGGENVASHELFHFYLNKILDDSPHLRVAIGQTFQRYIEKIDPRTVADGDFRARLEAYSKKDWAIQNEEAMALFLDAIANGSMDYKESTMLGIGSMWKHIGLKLNRKLELNTGKQVYNFLVDFQNSIKRGKFSSQLSDALSSKVKVGDRMRALADKVKSEEAKWKRKLKKEINEKINQRKEEFNKLGIAAPKEFWTTIEENGIDLNNDFWENLKSNFSPPLAMPSELADVVWASITNKLKGVDGIKFSESLSSIDGVKKYSLKIVAENNRLYHEIVKNAEKKGIKLDEQYTDKEGVTFYTAVTNRMRGELIVNNMPIAYALAKKSFELGAVAGTKKMPLEEWQSGYLSELAEFARTWNPSEAPFGAYVNKFLHTRYRKILETWTGKGPQTKSLSDLQAAGFDVIDAEGGLVGGPVKLPKGEYIADKVGIQKNNIKQITNTANLSPLKKSPTYKKVKALTKNGSLTPVLKVFGDKFGIPVEKLSNNKDLNGDQRDIARKAIAEISKNNKLIDLLPDGTDASGKSTGIANTKFGEFYIQGDKVTMAQTGSAAGLAAQVKNDNTTNQDFFDLFGMNEEGNAIKKGTEFDGAIREFVIQLASLAANQQIRTDRPGFEAIKIGKPKIMFSEKAQKDNANKVEDIQDKNENVIDEFDFGKKNINDVLAYHDLGTIFTIKEVEDIEPWINNLKSSGVFSVLPKSAFFNLNAKPIRKSRRKYSKYKMTNASIFTTGSRTLGSKIRSTDEVWIEFQDRIQDLFHDKDIKWGDDIKGIDNKDLFSLRGEYNKIFTTNKISDIRKTRNNKQKIREFNDKVAIIHKEMWFRINELIKKNTSNAVGVGTFLSLVGNDRAHWHKLGAQIIGFSTKLNSYVEGGKVKRGRFELEHAMPATAAYLYLLNASLAEAKGERVSGGDINEYVKLNFDVSYNLVIDNYKLIALDKAMDIKLRDARTKSGFSLQRKMGDGWSVIDGKWWQRYFNEIVEGINGGIDPMLIESTLSNEMIGDIYNINASGGIKASLPASKIKSNQNINDSFKNKINLSKPIETVGMATFDFDDTLARTKSGVRYTLPNIDGSPAPGRKVIFLAGSAGSGKSNIVKQLGLENQGFKIVNQDISLEWLVKNSGLPTDMKDFTPEQASKWGSLQWEARDIAQRKQMKFQGRGDGIVVDGTGASKISMQTQVMKFRNAGYDVQMIFVDSSLETALQRNRDRKERSLRDGIVKRNWEAVQNNKKAFKENFGNNFAEINTDNLKQGDPIPKSFSNKINKFTSGYIKGRLTAEEFASRGAELQRQGAEFDFSEFDKVVDGKPGPLLNKAKAMAEKYGTKDMFVLTARTQASAKPIQEFLKSQGLDIPLKNITGLANSTGEAKAEWMLQKFAEGYNDMYFVDDAFANVKAVQDVLNQLDIKSKVVQAKINFSEKASKEFNQMIERKKGIGAEKVFSTAEARKRGAKWRMRLYIPPSAEDFKGLIYYFLGKGKQGEADLRWFEEHQFRPFAKGIRAWNTYKQNMVDDYKALKKQFPNVRKVLNTKVAGTSFTNDTAIRVYLWTKAGFEIPGISKQLQVKLLNRVNNEPDIKSFADALSILTKRKDGYVKPSENWMMESIATDLRNVVDKIGRKEFLQEWIENKNIIFSPENLNKIEAIYGTGFREALENILYRMENGTNRIFGKDKVTNRFQEWINGSIGAIMFFNMRSAILQTMSTVNFINWTDNNMFKAAAAFANQKQFWKDFTMLFNSDQLKQRRRGLQTDVSASELTKSFSEGGYNPRTVINYLLQIGFTPTQIADSFAIAFGGSSFYRNRYNKYIKEGMSKNKAHDQAMLDFQEIAEETQQSSREDLISPQQASPLGRIILAFQNVTMQYGRLTKKSLSDLVNGRGDVKTNISKIIYYGMVQNIIFAALQNGLAFLMWGDDEEEIEDKKTRAFNSALDSFLRGTGLYGALVSTLKNTAIQWQLQKDKPYGKERVEKIILEAINLSPPIGSKIRKIVKAYYSDAWNEDLKDELGWRIENPRLTMAASLIEGLLNIPAARLLNKSNNLEEAITGNHEIWKRVALSLGWNKWELGIKDEEVEAAKKRIKKKKEIEKEKKKEEDKIKKKKEKEEAKKKEEEEKKKKGIKTVRCSGTRTNGERCGLTTETANKTWKCMHHMDFTDGMDRDGDGIKEYRCTATKTNGKRCNNKTENKNKKCYAHQ